MTSINRGRSDDRDAADALNRYLDDLASGVLAPRNAIDTETAAIVSHWRQAGNSTAEPAGLRAQLWEELMDSAAPIDARALSAPPLPPRAANRHARELAAGPGVPRDALHERTGVPYRWLAAALLILGLFGAGMIGQLRGGTDPEPTAAILAPAFSSSPVADQKGSCSELPNPYYTCPNIMRDLGTSHISPPELLGNEEQQVQLQGWAVDAGSTLTGSEGDAEGVVVDFVINGAYVATFNVPVVVNPGGITNDSILYLDAGETVELSRGDSVSYELGGLVELHNPFSVQRLEFKRAVIANGDISPYSATSDGVTTSVEGDTTLPADTGSEPRQLSINLMFVQILPGIEFPPDSMHVLATIGPVDPQRGPAGTEGFVLLIGPALG